MLPHRLTLAVLLAFALHGQVTYKKALSAVTAPQASGPMPNIGQASHLLTVILPTATAGVDGLVVRIEASFNGSLYFPISRDITTAVYNGSFAYAMERANGVFPFIRIRGVTVSATYPLDAFYTGSTQPIANVILDNGRFLPQASIATRDFQYLAAKCFGGTAAIGTGYPSSGAPVAACVTGSNTSYGVLQFSDSSTQSIQDHFSLPAGWNGQLEAELRWRTTATSGNVVWQIQTSCSAAGESGDPSWNAASTVTQAAQGTANRLAFAALASVTVTGCAAGEELWWRVLRDPAHASDTIGATAELLSVRFSLRRSE